MKYYSIIIAFLCISCGGEVSKQDLLPDANGEHGHILVVMQDDLWEGKMQTALVSQLDQTAKGPYLRKEPLFDFFRKQSGDLTHVNKMSRIILKVMVDFDSTYQETAVIEKSDYYAKGQLFLVIKDSDADRLYSFIQNDFDPILDKMNAFEMDQLILEYKNRNNPAIKEQAEKEFGISIDLPRDAKLKQKKDNFIWVKYDRSRDFLGSEANDTKNETYWIQEGILFWSHDVENDSSFSVPAIMSVRDTTLKYNVPGKVAGSYMATEYDPFYDPDYEMVTFNGKSCIITRGLWKHAGHDGAFGGGPFVQYSMLNAAEDKVITVCGYIYAPKFNKREYIREIEAMLKTIELK